MVTCLLKLVKWMEAIVSIIGAIIVGIASFFNYMAYVNGQTSFQFVLQGIILALLSVFLLVAYQGHRTRRYAWEWYRHFTLGYAIVILAFIGSTSTAIVLGLHQLGIITSL